MEQIQKLTIEKLSDEGLGVARMLEHDRERQVFVPYTLPGDVVEAEIIRARKKRLGRVLQIVSPAQERIQARCKHFGSCGGCTFQHMPYELQCKHKEQYIRNLFQDLLQEHTAFLPLVPSPDVWEYRNKMEFTFSEDKKGEKFLGLILARSRGHVFHLEECFLSHNWFQETVKAVRAWWLERSILAYRHAKNTGALRTLSLRHGIETGDRLVMLTVSANPDFALHQNDLRAFVEAVHTVSPKASCILRLHQIVPGKPSQFYEMKLAGDDFFQEKITLPDQTLTFQLSPSAFFQPNTGAASKIYAKAIEHAGFQSSDVVYDLYSGAGVFGMCVAHLVRQVIGIELSADCHFDATVNKERLGCTTYRPIKGDVGEVLKKRDFEAPDVVIVDPPRVGLDPSALNLISSLRPKTLVYVSCNPKTQRENIQFFLQNGFRLTLVQPIDQFPHTPHIENIAILKSS
jgi:23S rRNA (uracil1939-C5)-methyltransferase